VVVECPKCKAKNPDDTAFCGKCGTNFDLEAVPTKTMETPAEELTTGSTFAGRYQIIEELGRGGMGQVYKATDSKIKEKVALKLIKPEIATDKKTLERFSHELKTARKISHKNVGRMYELMEDGGLHFITMEYVSGQDLKGLIRQSAPLSVSRTIKVTKQICEGLAEAHRQGVVHRDLKPSNIMIDREGDIKIMDFGIARSLKEKGITGARVMIGTPEYMSPEQVEAKDVDQRSDIYSLGIMLYEMTTGKLPFEGDTALAVAMKHKGETPKPPKVFNLQIPDDLNSVILKCLEKEKEDRFQSAGEVRSELENIEKGIPTTEKTTQEKRPLTSKEITVTFGVKKLVIPAAAVVVLAVVAVVFFLVVKGKKAAPIPLDKPSLAILYFENNSGDKSLDNWRSGLSEMLITDLSQSRFVHTLSGDRIYSLLEKQNLIEKEKYSTEDLKKVASQGGASHILRGSYITAGDKFIISASLMKAETEEVISSIREEGMGEISITDSVDRITQRIKTDLNLTEEQVSQDLDRNLADITTQSPEAYKYFLEGKKRHLQFRFREAIPLFERAIKIDPEFALAYRFLAVAYGNLGLSPQWIEFMKKAMELKDRLSERERYIIEGTYYFNSQNTYDKARIAYQKILDLYPDNTLALGNMGLSYSRLGQHEEAIPYFERAKNTKDEFPTTYTALAGCYRAIGDYNKAKQVLEFYLKNIGESPVIHSALANHYRYLGEYNLALEETEKSLTIEPDNWGALYRQAIIHLYMGDLKRAEDIGWKLMEQTEPGARYAAVSIFNCLDLMQGRYERNKERIMSLIDRVRDMRIKWAESAARRWLAYVYIQTGNFNEAIKECEQSWELAHEAESPPLQRFALYFKGLAQIKKGELEYAEQTVKKLKVFIDAGMHKKSIHLYYHLSGEIELERKNYNKAVNLIRDALELVVLNSDALYIDSLASAYYESGNMKKAQEQYQRIISLTRGRDGHDDIYAKTFYNLGKIFEQQNKIAKAIENYEKFLDLWKNADPDLPEVDDAKKRLAGLKQ